MRLSPHGWLVYWGPRISPGENGSRQAESTFTTVCNRLGAFLVRLTPTERQRVLVLTACADAQMGASRDGRSLDRNAGGTGARVA